MKLDDCRKNIDQIDAKIIDLLNKRAAESDRIGRLKMRAGLPVIDLRREDDIIRRIARCSDGPMPDKSLALIYRQILLESRKLQSAMAERFAAAEVEK
ncbi:MAG TPA: hypothetical protein DEA22_14260 [Blastocatellia bacterium]|nr:hypothetical protein [Blastocatellia bacterium]